MANNIPVSFKVTGGELSNYIDQIQKKADGLTNSTIRSAQEQAEQGKKQLAIINEQISAIEKRNRVEAQAARSVLNEKRDQALRENGEKFEGQREAIRQKMREGTVSADAGTDKLFSIDRHENASASDIRNNYKDELRTLQEQEKQSKLQTSLTKEAIQGAREAAREQVTAIRSGDKTLADVYREVGSTPSEEEKLSLKLIEEQLAQDKKEKDKTGGKGGGILSSLLAVDNINKVFSVATQFTQTQNGFDLIQPASNLAGRIIGGALGGLIGSLAGGVGAVGGAAVGASIGGGFGDALGAFEQREAMTKEDYFKARNRYRGITGSGMDSMPDMANIGISATDFYRLSGEYSRKRGYADSTGKSAMDAIYAEKGLGVDQSTSGILIELQRSAKDNNKDLAALIGGVLEKGQGSLFKNGDTTFLNEFLGKFSSLQKELLKNSTNVASGLTMDVLKQFNGMGGMFDARDPRSMGIISSINGALSNPNSDNMKALAFGVLRDQNPNAGIFDLREQMQKGLGSPAYLKGMLQMVDRMGGDDQMKMNNLAGMFQGVPLAAIRTLFQNRKGLKSFSTDELKGIGITEDVMKGKAEMNTTDIEKNQAQITNGILGGEAVSKMADAFVTAIKAMLGGAVINLNNGQGTISLYSQGAIKQNATKKAEAKNQAAERDIQVMMDSHSTFRTGF